MSCVTITPIEILRSPDEVPPWPSLEGIGSLGNESIVWQDVREMRSVHAEADDPDLEVVLIMRSMDSTPATTAAATAESFPSGRRI